MIPVRSGASLLDFLPLSPLQAISSSSFQAVAVMVSTGCWILSGCTTVASSAFISCLIFQERFDAAPPPIQSLDPKEPQDFTIRLRSESWPFNINVVKISALQATLLHAVMNSVLLNGRLYRLEDIRSAIPFLPEVVLRFYEDPVGKEGARWLQKAGESTSVFLAACYTAALLINSISILRVCFGKPGAETAKDEGLEWGYREGTALEKA